MSNDAFDALVSWLLADLMLKGAYLPWNYVQNKSLTVLYQATFL